MSDGRNTRLPAQRDQMGRTGFRIAALAVVFAVAGCNGNSGDLPNMSGDDGAAGSGQDGGAPACSSQSYFESTAWPQVFSVCSACHVPNGMSGGTRFVLKPPSAPNALALNFAIAGSAARALTQNGTSLFLLKPTGKIPHGGGTVITDGTPQAAVLAEMVRQFDDPAEIEACGGAVRSPVDGLIMANASDTLRKASLQLAGRVPTTAELAAAAASDPNTLAGLDPILTAMMGEDGFYNRLKEMWNDLLLTDKNRFEGGFTYLSVYGVPDSLLSTKYCEAANWFNYSERTQTAQANMCINATESLAREPLEFVSHVVKNNHPFTEILTAQYRLFNVYEATIFGLDLTPYAGHMSDPTFFVETRFPAMHGPNGLAEEYAGLVTTTSFLFRYNSTGSNRNRGRAHRYYKFFLDRDVMKSFTRLDLSTIDLTKSPWRYDPQCTSCHATIDPVAGAMQHWTNCYDIQEVQYYAQRYCSGPTWYPDSDMFQPGTGPGAAAALTPAQLPTAMAVLANTTVADANFARAVATLAFVDLTGHPALDPPADPTSPDYAGLDAAYNLQASTIDTLSQGFIASNFDFKKLLIAVVKTPAFRAQNADKPGRLELTALGGGTITTPEILDRKIASVVGAPWMSPGGLSNPAPSLYDPPGWLSSLQKFRILAGGIDSNNVLNRQRNSGALSVSVVQRMALEIACQYTAWDFAQDAASRNLFPSVERSVVAGGSAADLSQQPIIANLKYLHQRFWGESPADGDPELTASYQLLASLQAQGAADILAGKQSPNLSAACAAKFNSATGMLLPQNRQFSDDANYMVRAWQGLIAYLLMDYKFMSEQ